MVFHPRHGDIIICDRVAVASSPPTLHLYTVINTCRSFLTRMPDTGRITSWQYARCEASHSPPSAPVCPTCPRFCGSSLLVMIPLSVSLIHELYLILDLIYKKSQQRLYLLRKLRSFDVSRELLQIVYKSLVESVLTFNIVVWYGNWVWRRRQNWHVLLGWQER